MDEKILRRKEDVKRKSEEKKWQGEKETTQFMGGSESESARLQPSMANAISARREVILCYIYI